MNLAYELDQAEADQGGVKYAVPEYSPAEVDAAGDLIIDPPPLPDGQPWSNDDYDNWNLKLRRNAIKKLSVKMSLAAGDDVVLVSTNSMGALRRAYPNYFMDTHAFIKAVNEALRSDSVVAV